MKSKIAKMYAMTVACLFLGNSTSQAADWVTVVNDPTVKVRVDRESVVTLKSGERKAWVEFNFAESRVSASGKPFDRFIAASLHRCDERTSAMSRILSYNMATGNNTVDDVDLAGKLTYSDVVPGSFTEASLTYICNLGQAKK